MTSARWNASSPKCSSRYRLTNTRHRHQPEAERRERDERVLVGLICMIRWYDAPSEIGGAPSVEMTSPIVSFCSN